MSEEKRETKEALLGELESIKDLLSEDEWDDIPVLSDTISVAPSPVDDNSRDDSDTKTDSLSASSPSVEHQMDLMGADAEEIPEFPTEDSFTTDGSLSAEGSLLAEGSLSAEGSLLAEGSLSSEDSLLAEGSLSSEGSLLAEGSLFAEDSVTSDQNKDAEDDFNPATAHIDTPPASDSFGGTPATDDDRADGSQSLGLEANQNTDIDAAVDKLDLDLSLDYDDEEDLLLDQGFEETTKFTTSSYAEQNTPDSAAESDELGQSFDHANAADKEFGGSDFDLDLDLGDSLTEATQGEATKTTATAEFDLPDLTNEATPPLEDEKPLAGLVEERKAGSINEPALDSTRQPSAKPSTDNRANLKDATPNIAELVHDLEELDQSMMNIDVDIVGSAGIESKDETGTTTDSEIGDEKESYSAVDTPNASDDSTIGTEDFGTVETTSAEHHTEENSPPEIIENSEFAKATPSEVEEYQHDAFAHLPTDEEPLSPFGPAGVSAIASLSQNYPKENDSGLSSVNISNTDPNLPPGVLPGQQSLFSGEGKNTKSDQAASHPRGERPTKASGENPFLPKHIRDRLHTNKALVDIIKESPLPPPTATRPLSNQIHDSVKQQLPPELSAERLHDMVEEVMALYMPRIEAELRERLLNEVKLIEPAPEAKDELGNEQNKSEDQNQGQQIRPDTEQ